MLEKFRKGFCDPNLSHYPSSEEDSQNSEDVRPFNSESRAITNVGDSDYSRSIIIKEALQTKQSSSNPFPATPISTKSKSLEINTPPFPWESKSIENKPFPEADNNDDMEADKSNEELTGSPPATPISSVSLESKFIESEYSLKVSESTESVERLRHKPRKQIFKIVKKEEEDDLKSAFKEFFVQSSNFFVLLFVFGMASLTINQYLTGEKDVRLLERSTPIVKKESRLIKENVRITIKEIMLAKEQQLEEEKERKASLIAKGEKRQKAKEKARLYTEAEAAHIAREVQEHLEREKAERITIEEREILEGAKVEQFAREAQEKLELEEVEHIAREQQKRLEREEAERVTTEKQEQERLAREDTEHNVKEEKGKFAREVAERNTMEKQEQKRFKIEETKRIANREHEKLERREVERIASGEEVQERLEFEENAPEGIGMKEQEASEPERAERIEEEDHERLLAKAENQSEENDSRQLEGGDGNPEKMVFYKLEMDESGQPFLISCVAFVRPGKIEEKNYPSLEMNCS
jgi:hypothetical protein